MSPELSFSNIKLWGGVYCLVYGLLLVMGSYLAEWWITVCHMLSSFMLTCSITYFVPLLLERWPVFIRIFAVFFVFFVTGPFLFLFPFINPLHYLETRPGGSNILLVIECLAFLVIGAVLIWLGIKKYRAAFDHNPKPGNPIR